MEHQQELISLIKSNANLIHVLKCVRGVDSNFWLGGGTIRSLVWDKIHNIEPKKSQDYDIIHFSVENVTLEHDLMLQQKLMVVDPTILWEVSNLLRHSFKRKNLYHGCSDWTDKASCVMVRLLADNSIDVIAPHGLSYVFNCVLSPNTTTEEYLKFLRKKKWLQRYSKLTLKID